MPARSIAHGRRLSAVGGVLRARRLRPRAMRGAHRGVEGRRRLLRERHQAGHHAAREPEIEVLVVGDWIETAQRQEVEVPALGIERRGVVDELGPRDLVNRAACAIEEVNRARPPCRVEAVGEPAAVGRPGDPGDALVLAALDPARLAAVQVCGPDLLAVIGEGDHGGGGGRRRRNQVEHPAEVAGEGLGPPGAVGTQENERLFTAGVGDRHDPLAVGEEAGEAGAGRRIAVAQRCSLPQPERERGAARHRREARSRGVEIRRLEVLGGLDEAPAQSRARARERDVDPPALPGLDVVPMKVGAGVVHDVTAVARRVARVEVLVIGVTAKVAPGRRARVEVAVPLVIGEEPDAPGDPHRAGDVAGRRGEQDEASVPLAIDPQGAGGTAPIAFPARRIGRVAAEDDAAPAGVERDLVRRPPRESLGRSAGRGHRVQMLVARERTRRVALEQDAVAVARPSHGSRVGAQPGEPPAGAAGGVHHVHLGRPFAGAGVGESRAVGREAREGHHPRAGGQPPRYATAGGNRPQVVLADEDDGVAVDGRVPVVAVGVHVESEIAILVGPLVESVAHPRTGLRVCTWDQRAYGPLYRSDDVLPEMR